MQHVGYRRWLKPKEHRLIRFATRVQGLMLRPSLAGQVTGFTDIAQRGLRFIVCPYIAPQDRGGVDVIKKLGETLNRAGEMCQKSGMHLCYHNHAFEFDNDGLRTLFRSASDRVKAQIDLGWVQLAGESPAAFVLYLGQRISSAHLNGQLGFVDNHDVLAGKGEVHGEGFRRLQHPRDWSGAGRAGGRGDGG